MSVILGQLHKQNHCIIIVYNSKREEARVAIKLVGSHKLLNKL